MESDIVIGHSRGSATLAFPGGLVVASKGIEPGLEWDTPMYRLAVAQLDHAAERMGVFP